MDLMTSVIFLTRKTTDLITSLVFLIRKTVDFMTSPAFLIQSVTGFVSSVALTGDFETGRVQKRGKEGESKQQKFGKLKFQGGSGTWGKGLAAPAAWPVALVFRFWNEECWQTTS